MSMISIGLRGMSKACGNYCVKEVISDVTP